MYPYLNVGPLHLGMFGLLLWLAAVAATIVLHRNFARYGVDADALSVVAVVMVAGVVGAKLWHELENPRELAASLHAIAWPGWHHPVDVALRFLEWFRDGFAWFGGMLAGIAVLMWQGYAAHFKGPGWKSIDDPGPLRGPRVGAVRMLDLAAPAAAIGYGVGRIGCLLAGDGDYGINTTLPWGVHMAKNALVPPNPPNALVQPTPIYELLFSLLVCWVLWQLGKRARPVGWLTGVYLVLSGVGRFLVEFVRINPKLYFGGTMSNAQVAALASVVAGAAAIGLAQVRRVHWVPSPFSAATGGTPPPP
ncbi:MAG TPA: prolipoprotein diacylglyceryl transferase family protein [Acidobacteriaceae bacterium]|nr:prolipoprotein diacylglyceryl transferase family protein [Acidobacteriaceae bacterium]